MKPGRRLLLCVSVLIASVVLASGCLIPYSYPKLSYLPGVEQGPELADCHVFRVDCLVHETDNRGDNGEYTLTEVPRALDGHIPSQALWSLENKSVVVGIISANYEVGLVHRSQLRLYRPGYELVELESRDSAAKVQWRPVTNWADQERTIDRLLNGPPTDTSLRAKEFWEERGTEFRQLPKVANYSSAETRPLLFAATEYERVGKSAATPADADRLKRKAAEIRGVITPPKKEGTP